MLFIINVIDFKTVVPIFFFFFFFFFLGGGLIFLVIFYSEIMKYLCFKGPRSVDNIAVL